jgi:serine/threonine protein kinase
LVASPRLTASLEAGERIAVKQPIPFGKYLLLERVNVGGMAEVFKAKAFGVEGFERLVAVKRILPSIAEDREFIEMFIDEAKIAVQLTHANVAQIFDLGKQAESYYIAMEFVPGKDARAIFDRARKRGETIPVPMVAYIVMKVCEGLDYAHNKRAATGEPLHLVHRDVSPQNILVSYDGELKLIDFGIAKATNKATKTQAGILKGKFGYMSPEQVRGLPIDRRSDVFSVGIVLYELLTGERLFFGESDFSTLEKVRNVEIMPPTTYNRKIPRELEHIVLKALAKNVEDRYQTAMDLHDDLQSFMYTSGSFFARKDLSAYMRRAFAEEIARETARDEQYRALQLPKEGRGAPIAPQAVALPVATHTHEARVAANVSKVPPPPPPDAMRKSLVDPPPPPGGAASRPSLPGRGTPPPPLPKPAAPSPVLDMEWDDDELATTIYDKMDELPPGPGPGPLAAPIISPPAAQPVVAPPPRSSGAPSPFDDLPPSRSSAEALRVPEPTEVTARPQRKSSFPAVLAALSVALLLVGAGAFLYFRAPTPGTIQFTTDPPDTQVFFDEQPVRATSSPFIISNVSPNQMHLVEVRREGYRNWVMQVELHPDQDLDLREVRLTPEGENGEGRGGSTAPLGDGQAHVTFGSEPEGASVTLLRGRERLPLGPTPVETVVDTQGGRWTVEMRLDGYAEWRGPLVVPANREAVVLTATLTGAAGEAQPRADAPATTDRASASSRTRSEPAPRSTTSNAAAQRSTSTRASSSAGSRQAASSGSGTLRINTRPASQVFVDGRLIGSTPQLNVPLSAGTHRVTLVNNDFNIRRTLSVAIQAGEATTKVIDLTE